MRQDRRGKGTVPRPRVWIIPGSIFVRRDGGKFNHAVVFVQDGSIAGRCNRLFLLTPFEVAVEGGTGFLVWGVPQVGRFGLSIG